MINVWSLAQKWQLPKKCLYHPFGGMLAWKVAKKTPPKLPPLLAKLATPTGTKLPWPSPSCTHSTGSRGKNLSYEMFAWGIWTSFTKILSTVKSKVQRYYENIDILIVDVRLLSFVTLGTRMAVCLYELVLTLTCKHSRNVSPQCNHPHQCCLGTPPCHHLAPWKIKNQTQRHHPTPNKLRNTNITNTKPRPNYPSISWQKFHLNWTKSAIKL